MTKIDLTIENDGRCRDFDDCYSSNARMRAFIGSWKDVSKSKGNNTWSHIGVYCRDSFVRSLKKQERRLVFLGLLIAYINGDRCAQWTDEEREEALRIAWEFIEKKR